MKPDVVLYMPLLWNVDHMVRLLESGINVISTANFITGHSYGEDQMHRLDDAAKRGGVSLYGTGISPGLAGALALTAAAATRNLERISIWESADCSGYASKETWEALGYGSPPDTPGLEAQAKQRQLVFMDAVEMMAQTLGVELDEVQYRLELGVATKDIDLGFMQIAKGLVCGMNGVWTGVYNGRPLIEIGLLWRLGNSMEPDWAIGGDGHVIEIVGTPSLRLHSEILRPPNPGPLDFTPETANPAVNAIRGRGRRSPRSRHRRRSAADHHPLGEVELNAADGTAGAQAFPCKKTLPISTSMRAKPRSSASRNGSNR